MSAYLVAILMYMTLVIGFGLYVSKKKVKTSDDFSVAGRRLPMIVLVGTLLATWCGAGGITGSANFTYNQGPWTGFLYFSGAPLGILLLYFIAGQVRKLSAYTIPEILARRYGDFAGCLATLCIFLAYVGIISYQFLAAGNIINIVTGMDLNTATLLCAVIIIILTVTGGMISVAYTDALSAFIMVGSFLVAVPLLFAPLGGVAEAFKNLPAGKNTLGGSLTPAQTLSYLLPIIFLMLGDQNMIQRFSAAKDSNEAKKSNIGMFIGEVVVVILIVLIVTAGIFLLPELKRADSVIFLLAVQKLPLWAGLGVIVGSMAFVVTTADSYLLSSASNLTYDVWFKYVRKSGGDREKLVFLRILIVIIGAAGYVLGRYFPDILSIQMYSYTMYGAAITPALLCALFYRKATKIGGVAGILAGAAVTMIWETVLHKPFGLVSALISVPVAFLVILLVSNLTQHMEKVDLDSMYLAAEQSSAGGRK